MRLGGALGPLGGLAGIVVLLGGVIVETFTKARHEMEETRKKFEEEIAKMANAAQASDLNKRMRDLLYGQPFDEKNQLSSLSKYAQGAFQGSLADLEAHYAALQAQIPRDATMAPAKIADEWNKVVKALEAARTQYAAATDCRAQRRQSARRHGRTVAGGDDGKDHRRPEGARGAGQVHCGEHGPDYEVASG
jgi:hypothetical protein